MRRRNGGLRKRCDCPRRTWAKCPHPWHLNFSWRGTAFRLSLDREVGHALTTKADAETEAERIRLAVRDGVFRQRTEPVAPAPAAATADALTFTAYAAVFVKSYSVQAKQKTSWKDDQVRAGKVAAFIMPETGQRIGDMAIGAITEDHIAAFLSALTARAASASTRNHYLQLFKSMSRWGVRKGHLTRPWLGQDSDLKREKPTFRHRRLAAGEEAALLAAAGPRLQRLILGALESCCRLGELLALRWGDVDLERRQLTIRAENAKDDETRILPLSAKLRAVLEMARLGPDGHDLPATAAVFGDEIGRPVKCIKKAWETAVLKAHGAKAAFVEATHRLTPECRAELKRINLHFHDLRHEGASRLVEAGVPIHHVQAILGHADLKTTARYTNATLPGLHESMRKVDEQRSACTNVAHAGHGDHRLPCNAPSDPTSKSLVN